MTHSDTTSYNLNNESSEEGSHSLACLDKGPFIFLLSVIRPFKGWVFIMLFVALFWAIVDANMRPLILKWMIDQLSNTPREDTLSALWLYASLYIATSFFMVIVFRWLDYTWLMLNPALKRSLGRILTEQMMRHSVSIAHKHFSGNLANKIKDTMSSVPDLIRLLINHFVSHTLALLIAIGIFWSIHPKFAIALLTWSIAFIIFSVLIAKKARLLSYQAAEVRSIIVGQIVDILTNLINIKLFSSQKTESKKLTKSLDLYVAADRRRDWFFLFVFATQGFSFTLYTASVLYFLLTGYQAGILSAGDFVAILNINVVLITCLWSISEDVGKASELVGNISQGLAVALSPIEIKDAQNAHSLTPLQKGEIEFKNVHFGYKEGLPPLFENLSVKIHPGEKVGQNNIY